MSKPILHFAHANGFPALSYGRIFRQLDNDFRVIHVDMFAHDPAYSVQPDWNGQADQLIDFLLSHADEPVIGVGHSFGASITFMAAAKRPDLFKGIIMIEPIFFIGWMKYLVAATKLLGLVDRFSPAGKTKNRRRSWKDRQEALDYFKSKSLFRNFDDQCLQDYLDHGLIKSGEQVHLRFTVEQELAIFRNGPHHFDRYKGQMKGFPGVVISGEQTDAIPVSSVSRFARQQGFKMLVIPGSHLFPLEQPDKTADLIREYGAKIAGSIH